jgi:hypothetical protein
MKALNIITLVITGVLILAWFVSMVAFFITAVLMYFKITIGCVAVLIFGSFIVLKLTKKNNN